MNLLGSLLTLVFVSSNLTRAQLSGSVPLTTDCRFWSDPGSHIQVLRQQKAPAGLTKRVWFFWNIQSGECRQCRQCQPPDMVTAVPCHYVSDTVCVNKSELEQFNNERRGYFYAHPDYHQDEVTGDQEEAGGFRVYHSEEPKDETNEVFGRKKFHLNHSRSKSLTSQIVSQRLNESGQLSFKQKLETFQFGRSDYGRPTFYSGHVTNNAALSSDASPMLEVAKVFLGDGKSARKKILSQDRQKNFGDIRTLFPTKKPVSERVVTPGAILQPPVTTFIATFTTPTTIANHGVTIVLTAVTPSSTQETELRIQDGDNERTWLILIFSFLSLLVIILLTILAYLISNREQRANKFSILDNFVSGRESVGHEGQHFTTTFQSNDQVKHCPTASPSVPPAVIRSLRNIREDVRRDVVVDITGRNSVR